jgi:hypothetical protein
MTRGLSHLPCAFCGEETLHRGTVCGHCGTVYVPVLVRDTDTRMGMVANKSRRGGRPRKPSWAKAGG